MRTRALIIIAVAALALIGCGAHNLVLKVDVLSYVDPALRIINVGDVPAGSLPAPVPLVSDMTVNLIEGLSDAAKVRSVTLLLGGQVSVASGSGSGRIKIYLSDAETDPLTTQPVMDVPVQFSASAPAVIDAQTAGDPAVAELFTKKGLRLAVVLDNATITSAVTNMTVTIGKLEAIVIAGRKID
jgi:hypothetical protein